MTMHCDARDWPSGNGFGAPPIEWSTPARGLCPGTAPR